MIGFKKIVLSLAVGSRGKPENIVIDWIPPIEARPRSIVRGFFVLPTHTRLSEVFHGFSGQPPKRFRADVLPGKARMICDFETS